MRSADPSPALPTAQEHHAWSESVGGGPHSQGLLHRHLGEPGVGWGGVGCQFPIAAITKFTDLMAQTIKVMEVGDLKYLTRLKSRCG